MRAPRSPLPPASRQDDDDGDDDATVLDIAMEPGARFATELRAGDNAFIYVLDGALAAAGADETSVHTSAVAHAPPTTTIAAGADAPSELVLRAGGAGARCLLFAGRPLDEPVVAHGPFVMCSPEEIRAAFSDYQRGLS